MFSVLIFLLSLILVQSGTSDRKLRQEDQENYFKKWLIEDVKHIITPEEQDVFSKLTTVEEKENFIEQFWFRRDSDPRTQANEFKEEHYRRIAYANERFRSGKPGWMTDRGRVYIIHGEPEYIERYPSGGNYTRKPWEGGGQTFVYPFEIWHYRDLEGIAQNVELEFVDPSFSGEYRLAMRPEEKDMLLMVSGTAPTIRELLGRREHGRVDRPYFNPGLENNSAWQASHGYRAQDTPFARYAKFANVQRPPQIRFADLQQIVTMNITYHDLPVQMRSDFIRLNEEQILAPITIQVENKDLTFSLANGVYKANANIYGVVRNMTGRIVIEFEDSLMAEYKPEFLNDGRKIKSVYQKIVMLEAGKRYRVDVVVRDQNSNRTGVMQIGLNAPGYKKTDSLSTSSLILSKWIQPAPEDARPEEMFVIGDVKIIPNVSDTFYLGEWLGAYLQVYHVIMDQATLSPQVRVRYVIREGENIVQELEDNAGNTLQFFSPQRLVLIRQIQLKNLRPGRYQLDIEVTDLIGQKSVAAHGSFHVIEPS